MAIQFIDGVKENLISIVLGVCILLSPSKIELFCSKLLLLHCKGALSFSDLMTVTGIQNQKFWEACLALGLIEDGEEWRPTSIICSYFDTLSTCAPR